MIVLVILATSALVQGIAINSAAKAGASATASVNNGISVQSGYEGYVVTSPKARGSSSSGTSISTWLGLPKLYLLKSLLKVAPSYLMVYGSKAVKAVAHLFVVLVLGVVTTTAMCTYTPLCTITPGDALQEFKPQVYIYVLIKLLLLKIFLDVPAFTFLFQHSNKH